MLSFDVTAEHQAVEALRLLQFAVDHAAGAMFTLSPEGRFLAVNATACRRLEYTRLEDWDPIFAVKGATWINLQYDNCENELRDAEQRFGVQIARWGWLDLMNDFEEIAALIPAPALGEEESAAYDVRVA